MFVFSSIFSSFIYIVDISTPDVLQVFEKLGIGDCCRDWLAIQRKWKDWGTATAADGAGGKIEDVWWWEYLEEEYKVFENMKV